MQAKDIDDQVFIDAVLKAPHYSGAQCGSDHA